MISLNDNYETAKRYEEAMPTYLWLETRIKPGQYSIKDTLTIDRILFLLEEKACELENLRKDLIKFP